MIEEIRFRTMAIPEGQAVVLQVRLHEFDSWGSIPKKTIWRDAKVEDLLEVGKIINGTSYPRTDPMAPNVNWSQS